eukprot:Sspe_Gene.87342::Locus_58513_Transcript_1_1_Confidence_1.000_Length_2718::g.87342::m.87342
MSPGDTHPPPSAPSKPGVASPEAAAAAAGLPRAPAPPPPAPGRCEPTPTPRVPTAAAAAKGDEEWKVQGTPPFGTGGECAKGCSHLSCEALGCPSALPFAGSATLHWSRGVCHSRVPAVCRVSSADPRGGGGRPSRTEAPRSTAGGGGRAGHVVEDGHAGNACTRKPVWIVVGAGYETREVHWKPVSTTVVAVSEELPEKANECFSYKVVQEVRNFGGVQGVCVRRTDRLTVTVQLDTPQSTQQFLSAPLSVDGSVFCKKIGAHNTKEVVARPIDVYIHHVPCQTMTVAFTSPQTAQEAVQSHPALFPGGATGQEAVVTLAPLREQLEEHTLHESQVELFLLSLGLHVTSVQSGLPRFPKDRRLEVVPLVRLVLDSALGSSEENIFDVLSSDPWLHIAVTPKKDVDCLPALKQVGKLLEGYHMTAVPRCESRVQCRIPKERLTPALLAHLNQQCFAVAKATGSVVTPLVLEGSARWYHVKVTAPSSVAAKRVGGMVQKRLGTTVVAATGCAKGGDPNVLEEVARREMKIASPAMHSLLASFAKRGTVAWTQGVKTVHIAGPGAGSAARRVEQALKDTTFPGELRLPSLPPEAEEVCRKHTLQVNRGKGGVLVHGLVDALLEVKQATKQAKTNRCPANPTRSEGGSQPPVVEKEQANKTCPVCLSDDSETLETVCGHQMCGECISPMLQQKTMQSEMGAKLFPICCMVCDETLPLCDILSMVQLTGFDETALLEASVGAFVRNHPEVAKCKNMHCRMLVRVADRVACCGECAAAAEQQEKENQSSTALVEALTKACPRCGCRFDKTDHTCNAVTCFNCGAGVCWLCLKDCGDDAHPHFREPGECYGRCLGR